MLTVVKFVQDMKTEVPNVVTLAGIVTSVRPVRPNAPFPMLSTLAGISIVVRLEHCSKADLPMFVTLVGIVTDAKLVHCLKAYSPMLVTPDSITTLVIEAL
jgi:hypothetical protein